MKLVNSVYDIKIDLKENELYTLVLESPTAMKDIVNNLINQCSGQQGEFVLADDDKIQKLDKKCDILLNPFLMDENNKKIISKLYSEMKEIVLQSQSEWFHVNSEMLRYIDSVVDQVPYDNLIYDNEADIESIFKAYNIKFSLEESIYDKVLDFIKIEARLLHIDILFMVHFKEYFTEEELLEIFKIACYNKINLIMIESRENNKLMSIDERCFIIDKDLCTIVK